MNRGGLFFKGLVLLGLFVLLVVPLAMIRGQIAARQQLSEQVAEDVAASYGGQQTILGPLLVVPYEEKGWKSVWSKENNRQEQRPFVIRKKVVIYPQALSAESSIDTEMRRRGIYEVPVYQSNTRFHGRFVVPRALPVGGADIALKNALLVFAISDMRGMRHIPVARVTGLPDQRMRFGGENNPLGDSALFLDLGAPEVVLGRSFEVTFDLALNGTQRYGVIPAADEFTLSVASGWPHPGFDGLMLPASRAISSQGFSASWQTNRLAAAAAMACIEADKPCQDASVAMNVSFVEPVTSYTSVERSVKYSYLLILLVFSAFMLFEVLRKVRIHPMQYTLVGAALAMFYLLLLALSEHISFSTSYGAAAFASVLLIGVYLKAVLRSGTAALVFCAGLLIVYAVLYVALLSEDYALLVGTTLLFGMLTVIMVATRNVDWEAYSDMLQARRAGDGPTGVQANLDLE